MAPNESKRFGHKPCIYTQSGAPYDWNPLHNFEMALGRFQPFAAARAPQVPPLCLSSFWGITRNPHPHPHRALHHSYHRWVTLGDPELLARWCNFHVVGAAEPPPNFMARECADAKPVSVGTGVQATRAAAAVGQNKALSPTKLTPPLCDIPSGCCSFTGPWTVTRSSLRMLRRVAAFCRPLRPVLLLVSFPRSRSPVVGVPGLC